MSRKSIILVSFLFALCVCSSAPAEIITEFTEPGTCHLSLRTGAACAMAFDVTDSNTVTEVQLKLRRWTGTTGEIVMQLRPDSKGAPSTYVAGEISRPVSEVSLDGPDWFAFKWGASSTAIYPGRWWIVCKVTLDSDAEINWQMVRGKNPYGSVKDTLISSDDGQTWSMLAFGDANFRVFGPRSSDNTTTTVVSDPYEIVVSGVATVDVVVKDSQGSPVQGPGKVSLSASDGTLGRTTLVLSNGQASTTWTAPGSAGDRSVTADYQGHVYGGVEYRPSTGSTTIGVIQEDRATTIEALHVTLTWTRTQSYISVTVRDALGNLVPGGTVSFDCGTGEFGPDSVAVVNGRASTTWTTGNAAGTFDIKVGYSGCKTVAVNYGGSSYTGSVTVEYTGIYTRTWLHISPLCAYKGKSVFVEVQVDDRNGNPVPGTVRFSTPSGSFSHGYCLPNDPNVYSNINLLAGRGTTKWYAPSATGTFNITAKYLEHIAGGNRYLTSSRVCGITVVKDHDSTGDDLSWMSEWISDYEDRPLPEAKQQCRGFTDKLTSALGWTGKEYSNSSAWEDDMKGNIFGQEDEYMDTHDFTFYHGHGDPEYITFITWHDNKWLYYYDTPDSWGDKDAEWVALWSCRVLSQPGKWGGTMNGLHMICGFHTTALTNNNFGRLFAEFLIKESFYDPAHRIHQAWFLAGDQGQPNDTKQCVVGASLDMFDDYIWGQGIVQADPPASDTVYYLKHDIHNHDPVADAGGPYNATAGQSFQLDGSGSYDPDTYAHSKVWLNWDLYPNKDTDDGDWDNDDRDESNDDRDVYGVYPVCSFANPGQYDIRLMVHDDTWNVTKAWATVNVAPAPKGSVKSSSGQPTAPVGQASEDGGLEIVDNIDPATLPTEMQMPLLEVTDTNNGFNEMMKLAGDLGMTDCNSRPATMDEQGNWKSVRGNHELMVNEHTGSVMYVNRARAYIVPDPLQEPLSEEAAVLAAEEFLHGHGIQRPSSFIEDVTHISLGQAKKASRKSLFEAPFQRRVNYRRTIEAMGQPYPVVGSGGKITVMVADDPEPVLFVKVWREASAVDEADLIGADLAIAEFHRLGPKALIGGSYVPPCNRIKINKLSLAYYEDDFITPQKYILPVYTLDLTCEDDEGLEQVQVYMSATAPPLEAIIEDPCSNTDIVYGEEIRFRGRAKGGTPPCTYRWESDVDGFWASDPNFVTSSLSVNYKGDSCACIMLPHTICLTVTDSMGTEATSFVKVTVKGRCSDFDHDMDVDFGDLSVFAASWMRRQGQAEYNEMVDLDGDGIVDWDDLCIFASEWLQWTAIWRPIGHWAFDEGQGTIASDVGTGGNDCSLIGDPSWVAGKVGSYALDFDGDGDYVKTEDITNGLDFAPGSFSASAWINARRVAGGWRTILEYERDGHNHNRFGLWLSSYGTFHFRVGLDTKNSDQVLSPDEWYLLTATYDAANKKMSLYINGQLDSSATHSRGFGSPSASKLTIGVRGWEDAEYFDGIIDDVRIYDFALSAKEVQSLFNCSSD